MGALWWGIALVLAGILLLVSEFLPVQAWRYWPLIIVAFGVRAMFGSSGKRWSVRNLGDGLVIVAIGLVLLGQFIGYLRWDVWLNILRLWPLLLVSLGLEIMGKSMRNDFVRALGSLAIVGGLAYGALVMTPTAGWPIAFIPVGQTEPFEFSEPASASLKTGSARIDGGVGEFSVKAGPELATASGRSPAEPRFEVSTRGTEATVRITPGSGSWAPGPGDAEMHVTLDEDVAWDLDLNSGVTEPDIDLSDLKVRSLRFDAGVSNGTLTLGRADAAGGDGAVSADLKTGVSSLTVRVPEGDDVRVSVRAGLTDVDMRGVWTSGRRGDTRIYESDRFDDSDAYWDIAIEAGVSSVAVEYY